MEELEQEQEEARAEVIDHQLEVTSAQDVYRPESNLTAQRRALSVEWYISHLDQHVKDSKKAYQGQLEAIAAPRPLELDSSIVGPTRTVWSATDKAAFFASISRHSRYRLDLVALDTGKTEGQVREYLGLVHGAAERVGRQDDPGLRDRKRRRWDMTKTWMNGFAPAAEEVEEEWIRSEEVLADGVAKKAREVEEENRVHDAGDEKKEYIKQARKEAGNPRRERKEGQMVDQQAEEKFALKKGAEEWNSSLDLARSTTLDVLLHPYSVKENETDQTHIWTLLRAARESLDKSTRIALDTKAIQHILSLDPADRTEKHQKALVALQARKKRRERLRMRKLVKQGMTEEEVKAQGGPDVVSLKQKGGGREFDAEKEWGEEWWLVQADFAFPTGLAEESAEESPQTLDGIDYRGIRSNALDDGWDLFNWSAVGNLIATSAISSDVVRGITDEMRAFLEPLVLHSIILAEQSAASLAIPDTNPATEPGTKEGGKITLAHVAMAMYLRGREPNVPIDMDGSDPSSPFDEVSRELRPILRQSLPPGKVPWSDLYLDLLEDHVQEEMIADWDAESTITDQEYEDLEEVLEKADEEFDRLATKRLWNGGDAPATKRRKSEAFKDETTIYKGTLNLRPELSVEYQNMLIDTMSKRRWRRAVKLRSKRFDRYAKRKEGGNLRKGRSTGVKSKAIIIDSDDEEVDFESEEEEGLVYSDEMESESGEDGSEGEVVGSGEEDGDGA